MFLIMVNLTKIYLHGDFNGTHVYYVIVKKKMPFTN